TKDGKSLRSYLKREMKKKDKAEELASAIPGEAAESTTPPNDLIFAPGDLSPTESEPIIVGEDAPTEATPVVAEAGSAVTETDPVVAESGSVVTKTDPVVAESGSAVTETDPVVAESGSAITKTDSVVAATESESTATASGSAGGSPAHSANLESLLAKTDSVMNETPATPDSLIPVLLIDNAPERESEAPSTVSMEELTDSQVDSLS
ncbi:MAG: hypothetical protein K2Z81_11945, partial [Cyanobacteria bacterium]|nr:hypothetical protein [Cyanobacteriota bacterium]